MNWREGQRRIAAIRQRPESRALLRVKEILALMRKNPNATPELEVEIHERVIENLVTLHKEAGTPFAWEDFLTVFDPYPLSVEAPLELNVGITPAKMRSLARGVLLGDLNAYTEALQEISPFSSIQQLGTTLNFDVISRILVCCQLTVNDRNVIPKESKTLTASGKVSTKAMAKGRHHDLYQDHVCSCVLRVGREILALLPVEAVIVTALVRGIDSKTGIDAVIPVLSVAITREKMQMLDFERLDPSDSMENFLHKGDVVASKRTGEFKAIEPLNPKEFVPRHSAGLALRELTKGVRVLRNEIECLASRISSRGTQHTEQKA